MVKSFNKAAWDKERKLNDLNYFLRCKYRSIAHGAKKRNKVVSFSIEEFCLWWVEQPDCCFYCGSSEEEYRQYKDCVLRNPTVFKNYTQIFSNPIQKAINRFSIDRKDNNVDYIIENICKCCWICNYTKGSILEAKHMFWIGIDIVSNIKHQLEIERKLK